MAKRPCLGRRYLAELDALEAKETFSCLVTVRYIHKVVITSLCSGCGSSITGGVCSYIGCHWNGENKADLKAWYSNVNLSILVFSMHTHIHTRV